MACPSYVECAGHNHSHSIHVHRSSVGYWCYWIIDVIFTLASVTAKTEPRSKQKDAKTSLDFQLRDVCAPSVTRTTFPCGSGCKHVSELSSFVPVLCIEIEVILYRLLTAIITICLMSLHISSVEEPKHVSWRKTPSGSRAQIQVYRLVLIGARRSFQSSIRRSGQSRHAQVTRFELALRAVG